jgi:tetratricopeptide (TPR) repeat protein
LFGIHPIQVEAVAWVSGLKDTLSGCCALLAVWQYSVFVQTPPGQPRRMHYGLATAAFVLALLAKPAAVVIPLVAWMVATMAFAYPPKQATRTLACWGCIAMVWSFWTRELQPAALMDYVTPWWGRPVVAVDAMAFYLGKLLWPVHLGVDYGRSPRLVLAQPWGYITGLLPIALGLVLWCLRPRLKAMRLAGAIGVAALLPMLGWVPFFFQGYSTVADRYAYVALLGPALGVSWGLARYAHRRLLWIGSAVVLMALGWHSARQVTLWHDTLSLFTHALQVNPRSALAHEKVGTALAERGQFEAAITHYTQALQLHPTYATVYNNLGLVLMQQDNLDAALVHFKRAIALKPDFAIAYSNAGVTLTRAGRLDEALSWYRAALDKVPDAAEVHYHLGNTLVRIGQGAQAQTHYARAVAIRPTWAEAYNNLGRVLADQGDYNAAITQYRAALRFAPGLAEAHNNLGDALLAQGDAPGAVTAFQQALALRLHWATASYNLGVALIQLGQAEAALAAYRTALREQPGWPKATLPAVWILLQQASVSSSALAEAARLVEAACPANACTDATALYALALVRQAQGDRLQAQSLAIQALNQAQADGQAALAIQIAGRFAGLIPEGGRQ